jgi:hypothetical protein
VELLVAEEEPPPRRLAAGLDLDLVAHGVRTSTPLVEPRSVTIQASPRSSIRACVLDTVRACLHGDQLRVRVCRVGCGTAAEDDDGRRDRDRPEAGTSCHGRADPPRDDRLVDVVVALGRGDADGVGARGGAARPAAGEPMTADTSPDSSGSRRVRSGRPRTPATVVRAAQRRLGRLRRELDAPSRRARPEETAWEPS